MYMPTGPPGREQLRHGTLEHGTVLYGKVKHRTTRYSTVQYATVLQDMLRRTGQDIGIFTYNYEYTVPGTL